MVNKAGTVTLVRDGAMMVAADKVGTTTAVTTVGTIVVGEEGTISQQHRPTLQPTTVDPVRDMAHPASLTTPPPPGPQQDPRVDSRGQGLKGDSRGKETSQVEDRSDLKQETQELAIILTTETKHRYV